MAKEPTIFTVADLANELDTTPMLVRGRLRNSDLTKDGKRWQWRGKQAFDAAVKALKGPSKSKTQKAVPEPKAGKPKAGKTGKVARKSRAKA